MKEATLCFLLKGGKILLAMKKRGFGAGKWNGVGGKIDSGKGDLSPEHATVRETKEEIGVRVSHLEKVAFLNFSFPHKKEWSQIVHVYLCREWEGEPGETEEMKPAWFDLKKIPFKKMWSDDPVWLPRVLEGKKVKADFTFTPKEKIDKYKIKEI
jgi:mutator protein MutT